MIKFTNFASTVNDLQKNMNMPTPDGEFYLRKIMVTKINCRKHNNKNPE